MNMLTRLTLALLFLAPATASAEDRFEKTIRPLLQNKCLGCHNAQDLKGGLSLESATSLRRGGASGEVITAGDPDASYLLDLITPHAGKAEMPKGAAPLTAVEIEQLRTWIEEGAVWPESVVLEAEQWWSFRPLVNVDLPSVSPVQRMDGTPFELRTPIDAFITEQLAKQNLIPSPEADRRTLIRRLSFDLLGLPPTPEQIRAFETDADPQAYEKLVEDLLQRPQYGERWGRHWLDIVKYADTHGYDKDQLRQNAWPYRDYVIRSFNEDKPYARFLEEQIAGDVLYPGTADGILGLGFIAAGPWDLIGHIEVSESKIDGKIARNLDRDDMVCSVMNTFNSVTIQCARCHDHKFDPYTQAHYYGLQAVFAAVDRAERVYGLDPETEQKRFRLNQERRQIAQELTRIDNEMNREGGKRLAELKKRIQELTPQVRTETSDPQFGYHSAISNRDQDTKWVQVDLGAPSDLSQIVLHPCHDDYAGIGSGFGFPVRFRIQAVADIADFDKTPSAGMLVDRTRSNVANPGIEPVVFSVAAKNVRFVRITATQLALRSDDFIFALGELEIFSRSGQNLALNAPVSALDSIEFPVRWARQNLTDGIWPKSGDPAMRAEYMAAVAERQSLMDQLLTPERSDAMEELQSRKKSIEQKLAATPNGQMVYAAATHFPQAGNFQATLGTPRPIHILHRGDVQSPRELAVPGTIPLIPGQPATFALPENHSEGDRRAQLARWISSPENPLTWRSIVNRVWQYHFGAGLVASPNDFGRMGEKPTHPELLEWLAVRFRDEGQTLKPLHRMIVTSSVYRQTASHHEENAQIDASNQFLWRWNRRRMDAEEIRDAILSVSGQLNSTMGGPGYYLFVLEKTAHSPHYEYQLFDPAAPESHRRSVYRFIVRSQPDPFLTTLDCADSSQSVPQRNETVTALQALALFNNRFNLEMSQRFADRLTRESRDLSDRVSTAFELVTGRQPDSGEVRDLTVYAEQFGLANLCRVLFNLNEFIYIE